MIRGLLAAVPGERRTARLLAAGALFAALLGALTVLPAGSAAAHASLVSSNPQNGQTVDAAPRAVEVELSEPVTLFAEPDAIAAFAADGTRVDAGAPTLTEDRRTVIIPLEPDLADGVYIVSWTVISADSHPMGGSIQFGVNVPATLIEQVEAQPDRAVTTLAGLVKAGVYLGLVVGLGVPLAALILGLAGVRARRARRWGLSGLVVAAGASVLQGAVQFLWLQSSLGADVFGARGGPAPDLGAGAGFAASPYALALGVRLILLGAAIGVLIAAGRGSGLGRAPRAEAALLLAAALGASATVAVNGHGGAGAPWELAAVIVHGTAAIVWLGGLALLALLFLRRRLDAVEVRRLGLWSVVAGAAVALLVLSGVLQALGQVGYVAALWTTSYGLVLVVKIALVVAAVALGAGGFAWARRERARPDGVPQPGQTARLRRWVSIELGVGIAIVTLSGILSTLAPAVADYAPTTAVHTRIGPYTVDVDVQGARTGSQRFHVLAVADDAGTRAPSLATLTLSSPSNGVESLPVEVPYRNTEPVAPDQPTPVEFRSTPANVPLPGRWELLITLEVDQWRQYSGVVAYDVEG